MVENQEKEEHYHAVVRRKTYSEKDQGRKGAVCRVGQRILIRGNLRGHVRLGSPSWGVGLGVGGAKERGFS